jgi:hypothetical protein
MKQVDNITIITVMALTKPFLSPFFAMFVPCPSQVPILLSLSEEQVWQLVRALVEEPVAKGTTVFKKGDYADKFYIVEYGAFTCFTREWVVWALAAREGLRGALEVFGGSGLHQGMTTWTIQTMFHPTSWRAE